MEAFADGVGLWVLAGDGDAVNVVVAKQLLEGVPKELASLVEDDAHGFWVTRKPAILKLQSDVSRCFSVNANEFAEIRGGVDDGECVECDVLVHVACVPWADEVHSDFIPRYHMYLSRREVTSTWTRQFLALANVAAQRDSLAGSLKLRIVKCLLDCA